MIKNFSSKSKNKNNLNKIDKNIENLIKFTISEYENIGKKGKLSHIIISKNNKNKLIQLNKINNNILEHIIKNYNLRKISYIIKGLSLSLFKYYSSIKENINEFINFNLKFSLVKNNNLLNNELKKSKNNNNKIKKKKDINFTLLTENTLINHFIQKNINQNYSNESTFNYSNDNVFRFDNNISQNNIYINKSNLLLNNYSNYYNNSYQNNNNINDINDNNILNYIGDINNINENNDNNNLNNINKNSINNIINDINNDNNLNKNTNKNNKPTLFRDKKIHNENIIIEILTQSESNNFYSQNSIDIKSLSYYSIMKSQINSKEFFDKNIIPFEDSILYFKNLVNLYDNDFYHNIKLDLKNYQFNYQYYDLNSSQDMYNFQPINSNVEFQGMITDSKHNDNQNNNNIIEDNFDKHTSNNIINEIIDFKTVINNEKDFNNSNITLFDLNVFENENNFEFEENYNNNVINNKEIQINIKEALKYITNKINFNKLCEKINDNNKFKKDFKINKSLIFYNLLIFSQKNNINLYQKYSFENIIIEKY